MPHKIDPREVLTYLNELGYTNISAQQLKEFIIDLKKIIKYEQRKHKTEVHISDDYDRGISMYPERKLKSQSYQNNNIFEILHNQPTQAFKAKMVNKIDRQIAIHITHSKKKNIEHEHCVHFQNGIESDLNCICKKPPNNKETSSEVVTIDNVQTQTDSSKQTLQDEVPTNRIRPTSKQSAISSSVTSSKFKKSKTAVLKNTASIKSLKKSDPVALYHQYQQEWKNIKFPGEDNHLDLRWAVREKLINGPVVEKPIKTCSSKRKVF